MLLYYKVIKIRLSKTLYIIRKILNLILDLTESQWREVSVEDISCYIYICVAIYLPSPCQYSCCSILNQLKAFLGHSNNNEQIQPRSNKWMNSFSTSLWDMFLILEICFKWEKKVLHNCLIYALNILVKNNSKNWWSR